MAISKDRMDRFTGGSFEVQTPDGKWVKMNDYVKSQKSKSSGTKKASSSKTSKSGSKKK